MSHLNRRTFVFATSGAAAGTLVVPGFAEADEGEPNKESSGLVTGKPKPPKFKEVPGFLSAAQIAPHHASHYGGALKAFTAAEAKFDEAVTKGAAIDPAAFDRLKQIQSSRGNSVVLHEMYFDGLALKETEPPEGIKGAIAKRFGSLDRWAGDFIASAKTAAGWAMLVVHPINSRLYNVVSDEHAQGPLWLSVPLVVIDTYEHAFYIDYQNRKAEYVEKFLKFVDWAEADRRYRAVTKT
jgi:superoxide dismutase, Fe-Mn family